MPQNFENKLSLSCLTDVVVLGPESSFVSPEQLARSSSLPNSKHDHRPFTLEISPRLRVVSPNLGLRIWDYHKSVKIKLNINKQQA